MARIFIKSLHSRGLLTSRKSRNVNAWMYCQCLVGDSWVRAAELRKGEWIFTTHRGNSGVGHSGKQWLWNRWTNRQDWVYLLTKFLRIQDYPYIHVHLFSAAYAFGWNHQRRHSTPSGHCGYEGGDHRGVIWAVLLFRRVLNLWECRFVGNYLGDHEWQFEVGVVHMGSIWGVVVWGRRQLERGHGNSRRHLSGMGK
jgi:hypothetical protein